MSKRITRSQTVCLVKAPVYTFSVNKRRESGLSKKCCQHLTPGSSQPTLNENALNDLSAKPKKSRATEVKPSSSSVKKTPAAEKSLKKGKSTSSTNDKDNRKNLQQRLCFESETTSEIPRKTTRSKPVSASEALVIPSPVNGKRKSEPTEKLLQHLASQSTKNKSTTRIQSPEPKRVSENPSEPSTVAVKKSVALNNVHSLRKGSHASIGKGKSSTKLDKFAGVEITKESQSHENQPTVMTIEQSNPDTSNIQLRRSTRITRGKTSKEKSEITTKVANRRHTISSFKTTCDENATYFRSSALKSSVSTASVKCLRKSSLEPRTQVTVVKSSSSATKTPAPSNGKSTSRTIIVERDQINPAQLPGFEAENTSAGKAPESQENETIATALSIHPSIEQPIPVILLRRSTRITRGKTSKEKSEITTKVANRRHTISSFKTTCDENATYFRSSALKSSVSTASVKCLRKSSSEPRTQVTVVKPSSSVTKTPAPSNGKSTSRTIIVERDQINPEQLPGFEAENTSAGKAPESQENETIATALSIHPSIEQPIPVILLRRSTRITRGKTSTGKSEISTKVAYRRHTIGSFKTISDGYASTTNSILHTISSIQKDSNAMGVTRTIETVNKLPSKVCEKRRVPSTKSARCKNEQSLADPNTTRRSTSIQSNQDFGFTIPDDLKKVLIDDGNFINVQKKLHTIPHGISVAEVVVNYATNVCEPDSFNPTPVTTSILYQGIIEYFDTLIGRQLLYESEREQYEMLLNSFPGVEMSKVYTPIYLLRLLVQLKKLLQFKHRSGEVLTFSMDHLNKFLSYLSDNKSTIFDISR